jgi:hypothetical protein
MVVHPLALILIAALEFGCDVLSHEVVTVSAQ